MGDYLLKRPMLLCGIGCCIISVIGFFASDLLFPVLYFLPIITLLLIFKKANRKLILIMFLIFAMCVSSLKELEHINQLTAYSNLKSEGYFTVCDVTYKSQDFNSAIIKANKESYFPKGTKIKVTYEPMHLEAGQIIKASITAKPIKNDDYKGSNYSSKIYLSGYLKDITVIKGENNLLLNKAEKVKSYIRNTLQKFIDRDETATLCALLFGEKAYFTDEFYNCVKASGVSHVMVVSGMHMAILVTFFVKILERLFYNKYFKALTMVLIVFLLTVLCGFTMSVLRAGTTYILMAIGTVIDRKGKPENTLGAAITLILISSPFAIFSISLQLSALSTFGILVIAMPILERIESAGNLSEITLTFITCILFSLSAMLLTLPITVYVFGYISTVSIITNLLISNIVTVAITVTVTGLLLNLISPFLAQPVFFVAELVTKYINGVISVLGSMPFATVRIPQEFTIIAIILIFAVLFILLACKNHRDMLKLKEVNDKIIKEGGGKLKWHP